MRSRTLVLLWGALCAIASCGDGAKKGLQPGQVALGHEGSVTLAQGSLPAEQALVVEEVPTPVLPEGNAALGQAFNISAPSMLAFPATLRLSVPAGAVAEELGIFQVQADGQTTLLETAVEEDENEIINPLLTSIRYGDYSIANTIPFPQFAIPSPPLESGKTYAAQIVVLDQTFATLIFSPADQQG